MRIELDNLAVASSDERLVEQPVTADDSSDRDTHRSVERGGVAEASGEIVIGNRRHRVSTLRHTSADPGNRDFGEFEPEMHDANDVPRDRQRPIAGRNAFPDSVVSNAKS